MAIFQVKCFWCMLTISSTLQHKTLSAAEGQQIASMTVKTLQSLHRDESFALQGEKVNERATALDISDLRCQGTVSHHEDMMMVYPEVIIMMMWNLFTNSSILKYRTWLSLVWKIISISQGIKLSIHWKHSWCKQDDPAADLHVVCDFYKPDFDREWLHTQSKH